MKRRVVVFASCCLFAAGIALASFLPIRFLSFEIYFFFAAIVFALAAFMFSGKARRYFIFLTLFFFGFWRYAVSLPHDNLDNIWHYNGQKMSLSGTIISEPVDKPKSQSMIIGDLMGLSGDNKLKGKVSVSTDRWPEYYFGQRIRVECLLERPGMVEDFDYGSYLAVQGIYSVCRRPQIEVVGLGRGFSITFWRSVMVVRKYFRLAVDRGLDEPEAGLFKAFILGDKATISDELSEEFRASGLSHIVAISGSHITMLSGMIFFLLIIVGLNRNKAFYFAIPFLLFYVLLAGAPPSAVRAGLMGFLVLLAFHIGRLNRIDHSLILSAAVMLLINPKLLVFDAGFQLSFSAVLGMIYLFPVIDKFLKRFYEDKHSIVKYILSTLALTVAAQIFTAPILLWHFGRVSLIAPLANLLALFVAPLIMGAGLAAVIPSLLIPSLAQLWFLPAGVCLKYLIFIARIFS
jgi:competence protein ComEC